MRKAPPCNALKVTALTGAIRIRITPVAGAVCVGVSDDGEGIAAEFPAACVQQGSWRCFLP